MTKEIVIDQPEALDMILKYLVDHKGKWHSIEFIHQELFSDIEFEIVEHLAKRIIASADTIVDYNVSEHPVGNRDNLIELKATAITESYLRQGGFSKYYADLKKREEDAKTEKTLTLQSLQNEIAAYKWNKKWTVINTVIALGALIVALIALFKK